MVLTRDCSFCCFAARCALAAAQQIPRIGVLWHAGSEQEEAVYLGALRQGFRDLGHVEGKSFVLENRFPNEQPERMLSMAAELAAVPVLF